MSVHIGAGVGPLYVSKQLGTGRPPTRRAKRVGVAIGVYWVVALLASLVITPFGGFVAGAAAATYAYRKLA